MKIRKIKKKALKRVALIGSKDNILNNVTPKVTYEINSLFRGLILIRTL
jgi:hypothetical protein